MDDSIWMRRCLELRNWPRVCQLWGCVVIVLAGAACGSSTDSVPVEFVAFGDIDGDGDLPFGPIPDVRIVVIQDQSYFVDGDSDIAQWWNTVGGGDYGISSHIPPGVQVPSSADDIEAMSASFVVTGPEGVAKTSLTAGAVETPDTPLTLGDLYNNHGRYLVCAISPVDSDLISGCGPVHITLGSESDNMVFVYFSNGRSFIDTGQDARERYQRFLDGTMTSERVTGTADVTFIVASDHYYPILYSNELIAIIDDADIGIWWEMISNKGENTLNLEPDAYGYGISFDSKVLENLPVRIAISDDNGTAVISLESGDYLFCYINATTVLDCDYETIYAPYHYTFVAYGLGTGNVNMIKLSESDSKQLSQDIQNWETR